MSGFFGLGVIVMFVVIWLVIALLIVCLLNIASSMGMRDNEGCIGGGEEW